MPTLRRLAQSVVRVVNSTPKAPSHCEMLAARIHAPLR